MVIVENFVFLYKYQFISVYSTFFSLVWLCFTSHRQRGDLEMAPPFTVPCEEREAR